ncbi:DIRP family protein [Loa loa]|uniref:DIRP family protein n=1 Tax=Loa loa TaxID=7209 RepID=A0A1I7VM60_LOALO|nr:DIRP family protein [Loa loa]EFO23482.2 DIRP family protein [Loa loa]
MPGDGESSRYHLRGPVKPPSRYVDSGDEGQEVTRLSTSKSKSKRLSPLKRGGKVLKAESDTDSNVSNGTNNPVLTKLSESPKKTISNGAQKEIARENAALRTARPQPSEISPTMRENLRHLKNVLKLPKARRWVYCEFFYSGVDQQLFSGDNEFVQLLHEMFPNLRTLKLCRPEWRAIRKMIGKPRRCSEAFLNEERESLETKRARIRQIYDGSLMNIPPGCELPLRLPPPLIIGAKIYARVRTPKDGIYAGTIDAILPASYRVVFDKEEMIPPMIIKDSEVMSAQTIELLSINYFLEQNRSAIPPSLIRFGHAGVLPKFADVSSSSRSPTGLDSIRKPTRIRDEKVGNFPVRMLVILVKLNKLIEVKRTLVKSLTELNMEAEKMNMITDSYPIAFQRRYAQVVIDIETVNRQLQSYLNAVNEYCNQLLPQLSEFSLTSRPEALRKMCQTHSVQIVKHCNNGLNVQNKHALDLVTSLTALLLQIRALGQQSCTPLDLHTLSESLNEIRKQIDPSNVAAFQDFVEVHMKQIHNMMLNIGNVC